MLVLHRSNRGKEAMTWMDEIVFRLISLYARFSNARARRKAPWNKK